MLVCYRLILIQRDYVLYNVMQLNHHHHLLLLPPSSPRPFVEFVIYLHAALIVQRKMLINAFRPCRRRGIHPWDGNLSFVMMVEEEGAVVLPEVPVEEALELEVMGGTSSSG